MERCHYYKGEQIQIQIQLKDTYTVGNMDRATDTDTSVIKNQIQLQRKERVGGFKRAISGEVSLSSGEHNK